MPSINSVNIDTALKLPAPDVKALSEGRAIAAMPRTFIDPGRKFALYPADTSINLLPTEQQYRPNFLSIAQTVFSQLNSETVTIKGWARCELCQIIDNSEALEALSQLTIWTEEALQQILSQRPYIFLAYLRVYPLPHPLEVPVNTKGNFVSLPHLLTVTESSPVVSDRLFSQRQYQLENRLPPSHPELEELQNAIAQMSITDPASEKLNHYIKTFLGWANEQPIQQLDPDLSWISTINDLGTATTGGNYEKGTAFEQIVHKSLAFLGFGVDPNAKGGAGGMDLYCIKPYPLVGECKAGKSIPDGTVEELIRIGTRHLGADGFQVAVKLIIGPGQPTPNLQKSAEKFAFGISIINPMTLQKLVQLQAKFPGSVNPIELKPYLVPGQIDYRIDEYIQKVESSIRLRSHLVQLVKNYLQNTGLDNAGVEALHGAYFGSHPPQLLKTEEMHDILIELSSPLTGYLGRKKGSDGSDRFYFLRDLPAA
ncbi:DUF1802 family protein [Trichocoleus sp. DQ-U1]|uniref:DUF1802 family protein n=1 Tax=Trichocoleus sp. DQ-U1 TaxID=2933926 RepID=UPI003298D019